MTADRTAAGSAETVAMLLADARLPSGAHTYSGGVEPALAGGLSPAEGPELLRTRAITTALLEAGVAVAARSAAGTLRGQALAEHLRLLSIGWAARTPSPAQRVAARSLGRGLRRVGERIVPEPELWATLPVDPAPPKSIVLGLIASAFVLPPEALVRLVVYDEVQSGAAALLKLEPMDPVIAASWVLDACQAAEPYVPELADITDSDAVPAVSAPQAEDWAEAHALLTTRLFRA